MRPICSILVLLSVSQILAKSLNAAASLRDSSGSESAPDSAKLSPPVDGQESPKKQNSESSDKVEKRQVGVIYRDNQPVGILQPFKRSYRFIPVREELLESLEEEIPENEMVHKRDLKKNTANKRHNQHQKDTEKFSDKLKNILDDMGLIEDTETVNAKRENPPNVDNKAPLSVNADKVGKENENRNKRNEHYLTKSELPNKREKPSIVELNENYDGGDDDDDEKRIERQIRNKINSLKDQVKREIEAIKQQQQEPEDWKRKKRGIENSLIDSENDSINPIKQADVNLDPLIRRRRNTDDNEGKETDRIKRRIDEEVQDRPQKLSDLSDSDLFGALPRDFDGELSRFKRVKRKANK